MKKALASGLITMAMLLAGCSSPRFAVNDFCAKQGRQISKEERVIYVLQEVAKREDRFGFLHFMQWRKKHKLLHPRSNEENIAKAYYAKFPSCCAVMPPAYLSRELLDDNAWDNMVEELLGRHPGYWVVDVRLPMESRPLASKRRPVEFERIGVSDCNDKVSSGGFWL